MLQNKRLETKMISMKNEITQAVEQREAMKDYIRGLENALSTLQRKFDLSGFSCDESASIQEKIVLDQAPLSTSANATSSSASKLTDQTGDKVEDENTDISSKGDFKIKFMQKAFKSLLKARDSVAIRRHSEVMCSLLSYNACDRKEVLTSIEKLGPLLSALGINKFFMYSLKHSNASNCRI